MRIKKPGAIRQIEKHGLSNMAVYWSFKYFPTAFNFVSEKLLLQPIQTKLDAVVENMHSRKLFDYWDWTDVAGTTAAPKDQTEGYIWFLPCWSNVWGGGHYTIFRFANQFCHRANTNGILFIYDYSDRHTPIADLQAELNEAVPNCRLKIIGRPAELPRAKAAIATTWQSAYFVRAFPHCEHKFYFMQDYESQFYAYGTASMQANNTYSFGFSGITGGTWLKHCYQSHGGSAVNYRFATDRDIFHPADAANPVRPEVKRIFFYGRPSTERRCFELGMAGLHKIANEFPDVEIVIAGLDLSSPPPFKATLLGNMSLAATGDLYRTCDIGMAFSGTNLSYLPVELMASGVPVISNNGPQVEWHCKHGENAWLVDPTPTAVLEGFRTLVRDRALRQRIATGGVETMRTISWPDEIDKIYDYTVDCLANAQQRQPLNGRNSA